MTPPHKPRRLIQAAAGPWRNSLTHPVRKPNEMRRIGIEVLCIGTIAQRKVARIVALLAPPFVALWTGHFDRLSGARTIYTFSTPAVGAQLACVDVGCNDNFFLSV